jgi:hypothetical protein
MVCGLIQPILIFGPTTAKDTQFLRNPHINIKRGLGKYKNQCSHVYIPSNMEQRRKRKMLVRNFSFPFALCEI